MHIIQYTIALSSCGCNQTAEAATTDSTEPTTATAETDADNASTEKDVETQQPVCSLFSYLQM